jgi:hypothetical protein
VFERVLAGLGPVGRVTAPSEPEASQRLRSFLSGVLKGASRRTSRADLVHVELSGRALFEFGFVLGLTCRRRRPWVAITCHDAPSIVGSPLLFAGLDRRGIRRLGALLSRVPGRRLETRVMESADTVVALTRAGASALGERYRRDVTWVPHLVGPPSVRIEKAPTIFVPGYVSDPASIVALVDVVANAVVTPDGPWRVTVGACGADTRDEVLSRLRADKASLLTFTGVVDEAALMSVYANASVVVRFHRGSAAANSHAASGPLCWAVSQGCRCVTNDDRSGAQDLAADGLIVIDDDPVAWVQSALASDGYLTWGQPVAQAAQSTLGIDPTRARYVQALLTTQRSRERRTPATTVE